MGIRNYSIANRYNFYIIQSISNNHSKLMFIDVNLINL